MSDFRSVFGPPLSTVVPRFRKAISVLHGAIKADNLASNQMPARLQIEVTDKCNYNCIMCNRENLKKTRKRLVNTIEYETFERVVNEVNPYYVALNGLGEPFLNRDIFKIISLCREHSSRTFIPTDLGVIDDKMFDQLISNPPDILTVSMHGAVKQTYEAITLSHSYEKFVFYFERLLSEMGRNRLRILCALQAKNLREYAEFYECLAMWGMLEKFCLVPMFDFQIQMPEEYRVIPTEAEKRQTSGDLDRLIQNCGSEQKRRFLQKWKKTVLEIRSFDSIHETGPCLVPWSETYITAKGDVLPCCYLTSEVHKMGNIHSSSFQEIWNGGKYQAFRSELRENRGNLAGCKNCPRNDMDRVKKYRFITGWKSDPGWRGPSNESVEKGNGHSTRGISRTCTIA